MKRRTVGYNPKRKIATVDQWSADVREALAARATYGGNPEHKRTPGDYGLAPPTLPRPGKTLCDSERQILKAEAQELLLLGIRKGMMSIQTHNDWPQNVWALSESGEVFEAQLENAVQGTYHGYPMPRSDDFRDIVIREWSLR